MPRKTFLRRQWNLYSKIGRGRKKLQKWRKPKGRDNKMRLKRKGYPITVSIGYSSPKKESGKIEGKLPILVHNVNDLNKVGKDHVAIIARVGAKKKLEIIKVAQEKKIHIVNLAGDKK